MLGGIDVPCCKQTGTFGGNLMRASLGRTSSTGPRQTTKRLMLIVIICACILLCQCSVLFCIESILDTGNARLLEPSVGTILCFKHLTRLRHAKPVTLSDSITDVFNTFTHQAHAISPFLVVRCNIGFVVSHLHRRHHLIRRQYSPFRW